MKGRYEKHMSAADGENMEENSSTSTQTMASAHETSCSIATPTPRNKRTRGNARSGSRSGSSKRLGVNEPVEASCESGGSSTTTTAVEPEEDSCSLLDDVLRQLAGNTLELTANDRLQLERSARSAMRTLLQWIDTSTRSGPHPDTIRLQLLAARMQLLWTSYHTDGHLDAVQMLTVLFLLVIRSSVFRDVPVEPWDCVDLAGGQSTQQSLASLRATLLRHLTPLYSCVLPHVLMQCPATLELCQMLIQDLCPCGSATAAAREAQVEDDATPICIPDGVRAIVLDLDDTVFLHQQVRQLREVYWVLAQAKHIQGVDEGLLRDVVMPAVPQRSFLLRLIDAMTALGRPVYVASFGLKEWVLPVAELVLGDKVPVENIYALDGHPPRFPVVLNKNLWLADVMEKHGLAPRDVLLVDDQISNVARALAGGFSALQVPPSRGLDATIWNRALANATGDHFFLPPPPRTHAYCPAEGAVFAEDDMHGAAAEAYRQAAEAVVIQAPEPCVVGGTGEDKEQGDGSCDDGPSIPAQTTMPMQTPTTPRQTLRRCMAMREDAEDADTEEEHHRGCDRDRSDAMPADSTTSSHHRFILKHGDFEAVRSTPATPIPRSKTVKHVRTRSQDAAAMLSDDTTTNGMEPKTPPMTARPPRPPLRRVRSFSAAGWWGSMGGFKGEHVNEWTGNVQFPALCAQMARLGMTAADG